MGLLDEAIREHLELKRRRGGDPSAIAREERDALAQGVSDPSRPADANGQPMAEEVGGHGHGEDGRLVPGEHAGEPGGQLAEYSTVGQETAELDMQAVIDGQPEEAEWAPPPANPAVEELQATAYDRHTAPAQAPDWLEGEVDGEPASGQVHGQERLSLE
jgi:hypothetical protein